MWPDTVIDDEIEAINSATFLTEEQKRDIFYNNAAAPGVTPGALSMHRLFRLRVFRILGMVAGFSAPRRRALG